MSKGKPSPLSSADLAAFVGSASDFDFEMRTLVTLRKAGLTCSHSGSYKDPITGKIRQFDIRAMYQDETQALSLAVECKALSPDFPLLISTTPRTESEAFHDLIVCYPGTTSLVTVRTVASPHSYYKRFMLVGRKTDQVRKNDKGQFSSDDSATFEKITQAVNGSRDLIHGHAASQRAPFVRCVIPVLVVPDDCLWQADYTKEGSLVEPPRLVDRSSLLLDTNWQVTAQTTMTYRLSHLEIVTLSNLRDLIESLLSRTGLFSHQVL